MFLLRLARNIGREREMKGDDRLSSDIIILWT